MFSALPGFYINVHQKGRKRKKGNLFVFASSSQKQQKEEEEAINNKKKVQKSSMKKSNKLARLNGKKTTGNLRKLVQKFRTFFWFICWIENWLKERRKKRKNLQEKLHQKKQATECKWYKSNDFPQRNDNDKSIGQNWRIHEFLNTLFPRCSSSKNKLNNFKILLVWIMIQVEKEGKDFF